MKSIFLFFIFTLTTPLFVEAQYKPMLDSGSTWNYRHDSGLRSSTDSIYMVNDTVVNGLSYKIIRQNSTIADSLIYLREDTVTGQVWIRHANEDHLLFDFSLNIGDDVVVFAPYRPSCDTSIAQYRVIEVDTFIDLQSQVRRRLTLEVFQSCGKPYGDIWIEGIGSLYGITEYDYTSLGPFNHLLCAWHNGEKVFDNINFNTCKIDTTISTESYSSIRQLQVYPNPAETEIHVIFQPEQYTPTVYTVHVLDILGREIIKSALSSNKNALKAEINIYSLSSGTYFIQIHNEQGSILEQTKMIKQ